MSDSLKHLLNISEINPVLADIGCSGTRFKAWDSIAGESVMLGFDPDSREIPSSLKHWYKRVILIDRAVCGNDKDNQVDFVLTEYPSCSSTLEPDLEALGDYGFQNYFIPTKRVQVPATSLNRVINDHDIETIDWIKIDSQGIDLTIIKSINEINLARIVAIDVEPGLIDAYQGEDLFPEVHEYLTSNGFWLADFSCQSYPRVKHESLNHMAKLVRVRNHQDIQESLKGSPTAAEARYLRTIPCAADCGERQLILLYVFALVCGLTGFAYDVSRNYAEKYNKQSIIDSMIDLIRNKLEVEVKESYVKRGIIRTFLSRNPRIKKIVRKLALELGIR